MTFSFGRLGSLVLAGLLAVSPSLADPLSRRAVSASTDLTIAAGPVVPSQRPSSRVPSSSGFTDSNRAGLFGLRGSLSRVEGDGPSAAVSVETEGVAYASRGVMVFRLEHFGLLGVGPDGVEGGLGVDYALGARALVAAHQGPLFRVGFRGHLLGNQDLYSSNLEVPQLQLGYQVAGRPVRFELSARGGAVLAGRYNAAGGRRPLGDALEYGGLIMLRVTSIQLDLQWTRYLANHSAPNTPVDTMAGLLCSAAGWFGMCLDARYYAGDLRSSGAMRTRFVHSTYAGISLGATFQNE